MQVQQFYDYTDMLKANLQSAITIGGKLQFKDEKQYQEFLDAGLIIGSLLVNSESANVYNTSDNTIWDAVEAKVTLWGGDPANDMNLRHLALVEVLEPLSAPDDILVQIEKVRVVAKFDVVDETKIQFGDQVYVRADPLSSKGVPHPYGGVNSLRLYVDSNNSNALKDGLTWATAFNELKDALDYLHNTSNDLRGMRIEVFITGGSYLWDESKSYKFDNGDLYIVYINSTWNGLTTSFAQYMFNGQDDKTFTDDPVEITASATFGIIGSAKVSFHSRTEDWKYIFGGFKFTLTNNANYSVFFDMWNNSKLELFTAHIINQADKKFVNTTDWTGQAYLRIYSMKVEGLGTESTSLWNGLMNFGSLTQNGTIDIGSDRTFHASYSSASGKKFEVNAHPNLISFAPVNDVKLSSQSVLDFSSLHYVQGAGPSKTSIRLNNYVDSGVIAYDSSEMDIILGTYAPKVVKDVETSLTKIYLSKKVKTVSDYLVQNIKTSVPTDSTLENNDLQFYIDESTDTLKVKYKDSGGVVQTGEIAVLT